MVPHFHTKCVDKINLFVIVLFRYRIINNPCIVVLCSRHRITSHRFVPVIKLQSKIHHLHKYFLRLHSEWHTITLLKAHLFKQTTTVQFNCPLSYKLIYHTATVQLYDAAVFTLLPRTDLAVDDRSSATV